MASFERKMNRRDMLKELIDKGRDTSLKVTTQAVGEYAELSEVLREYRWEQVDLTSPLSDKPRQVMYKSRPYFVSKLADEVIALDAICPVDQQMIFWQNHSQTYNCLMCRQKYDSRGWAVEPELASQVLDLAGVGSALARPAEEIVADELVSGELENDKLENNELENEEKFIEVVDEAEPLPRMRRVMARLNEGKLQFRIDV